MLNKIVGWLVLVPLCLGLVAFALANRQLVPVYFNPFAAHAPVEPGAAGIPLFIILYVVLLIGVMLGGVATWFAQGHHRRREKHWRREAQQLSQELETQRRKQGAGGVSSVSEVDDLLELR